MTAPSTASTSQRLIAAAQALIAEDGWASATTRKVAARAGVNPGLVHYHVGSIEALRRTAILDGIRVSFAATSAAIERADSATEVVDAVGTMLREVSGEDPHVRLLHESLVASMHDVEIRSAIAALLAQFRATTTARLETTMAPDPTATAATIVAVIDGAILQRSIDPSLDVEPIIRGLRSLLGAPSTTP
jgi:AcrR family transcriptional regulator